MKNLRTPIEGPKLHIIKKFQNQIYISSLLMFLESHFSESTNFIVFIQEAT